MKRSAVPQKYKWDLTAFAKDDEDFKIRVKNLLQYENLFKSFEGKLDGEDNLLKVLNLSSEYSQEMILLYCYAKRKADENLADSKAMERLNYISKIENQISVASSFITPEVSKFSNAKLNSLMKNPKFSHFRLFFKDIIKEKPHILPKNEEKLLSGMGDFLDGFSSNHDAFSDADLKFNDVKDGKGRSHKYNQALYSKFMHSPDRELRKNTFAEENGAYGRFINFISNNYISEVKANCYFAKIRKYDSALASAISGEDAKIEVYNALIENVHKHLKLLYKYFEKKKKILGYDKFYIYDQFAPLKNAVNKTYTFEQAIELIKKAVAPLGEEYVSLIDKAVKEKWIDVMPNDGKAGGAYSSGAYGAHPVVLTNFTGDFQSVTTLAHELGHALHTYYSNLNNIFEESDYVIFVAEVASTVNEMLLRLMLLNEQDSASQKSHIIDELFTDVKGTIFRQTMFAEFEEWAHEEYEKSHPLSKDKLCEKYLQLNKLYFGKGVVLTKETQFEWARIPHFYSAFYVYKYATGLISALNIVSRILKGEEGAKQKYLNFLKSGCKKGPVELLQDAGVDLEKQQTFDEVFAFLEDLLKEM